MSAGGSTTAVENERTERGAGLALATTVMAMVALPFGVTGTNLALPLVRKEFGSSLAALSWTLSGYSIVMAAFTMLGGTIASRIGTRRTFRIGVAVLIAGTVLCIAAPNTPLLITGRVIQALGGSLIVPASVTVALVGWPESRRAFAIGIWTAAFPLGSATAPTISSALLSSSHSTGAWRLIFVVPLVLAVSSFALSFLLPREDRLVATSPVPIPDLVGMVVGTAAAGLMALALVQGRAWGWTSVGTLTAGIVAIALVPVFVRRSLHHPRPFLPARLFRVPSFRVANIANVSVSAIGIAVWLIWPLVLRSWHYSAWGVGLAMSPTPCITTIGAVLSGRLVRRFGYRPLLILGAVILVIGNLWLMLNVHGSPAYWLHLFPGLVMIGAGMGLLYSPLNAAGLIDLDRADFATGNAAFNTGRSLSGAVGIAGVVATLGEGGDPLAGFRRGYALLTVMAVISFIALTWLWPKKSAANTD